jgi:hypothetical protein
VNCGSVAVNYRRFDLGITDKNRAFDDVLLPELDRIKLVLDQLQEGKLDRASFLFYGVPGAGKTKTARAIAQYHDCDVVVIRLGLMTNDNQLMSALFSKYISDYQTGELNLVPLRNRLYLFEDIDAESTATHRRKIGKDAADEPHDKEVIIDKKKDKLTLSGILNALDGVLKLQGARLVMSTNHPELLDPAILRRVTMQVEFKKLTIANAHAMISKKFGESVESGLFVDYELVPADLEGICNSCSSVAEVKTAIIELKIKYAQIAAEKMAEEKTVEEQLETRIRAKIAAEEGASSPSSPPPCPSPPTSNSASLAQLALDAAMSGALPGEMSRPPSRAATPVVPITLSSWLGSSEPELWQGDRGDDSRVIGSLDEALRNFHLIENCREKHGDAAADQLHTELCGSSASQCDDDSWNM